MALKICFKIRKYEKKMLLLPRLEPQTLCMVVLNANHYTRTDDKNNDEIITLSNKKNLEQIFKSYFSETFVI